jgi:hypothetical protein
MITAFFKKKSTLEESSGVDVSSSKAKRVREVGIAATSDTDAAHQNKKHKDESDIADNEPRSRSAEVEVLLEHLQVSSWKEALDNHISSKSFELLAKFVITER